MSDPIHLLWPRPAEVRRLDGVWRPGEVVGVTGGEDAPGAAVERVEGALAGRGVRARRGADGAVRLVGAATPADGYRLRVDAGGVEVAAGDVGGFVMGAATFGRWLDLHAGDEVPAVEVVDRPSFARRGVLLDVSRNRVRRLETLLAMVDELAGWGISELQLYTEHTFAYRGHEVVWRGFDPYTGDDVRRLDARCRDLGVELVPNQNSFGHLHRWLVHEPYRRLAEVPEGIDHIFSVEREPFSLCPTDPGALDLLDDLYDQLLPCFTSRVFDVGLDETLDLCLGRSAEACRARGKGRVYLDFLRAVHARVTRRGHRMQFWGDVVLEHPEIVSELPKDAIALEWGYDADHPFARDVVRFAASGLDFYVCPGTASWNGFAGRVPEMLPNLAAAASAGAEHGALGMMVTDWGDHGHLQPLVASWPGLLVGAGLAWRAEAAGDVATLPLPELLDRHVFRDAAGVAGRAAVDLASAYTRCPVPRNGAAPFFLLLFGPQELDRRECPRPTLDELAACQDAATAAVEPLAAARPARPDGALLTGELRWAADALGVACRVGAYELSDGAVPPSSPLHRAPAALARDLADLVDRLRPLWLARDRPGALDRSIDRLLWHPRRLGLVG